MKIIYIVNTRIPTRKAHGFQITKTCEVLARSGVDVELWIPYRKNEIKETAFEYYGLEENFNIIEIPCFDVVRFSKHIGSIVFYLQTLLFSFYLLMRKVDKNTTIITRDLFTVFLFRLRGKSVVYNAHNWSYLKGLFSKLISKNTPIICNSKGTQDALFNAGFKKTTVIHNGVDVEDFDDFDKSIREKLTTDDKKNIAMYVGHLYKWKGIDVVVESARILKNNTDILFVIVGGNEEDIEIYKEKIKDLKNILFIGHVSKKEISSYMSSANVLLLPNTKDSEESVLYTSPIKMFEYMASGVPVIASDLPSIREVLNKDNAILIRTDDPKDMTDAILSTLVNKEVAILKAEQARKDVLGYTWNKYGEKILNFLE